MLRHALPSLASEAEKSKSLLKDDPEVELSIVMPCLDEARTLGRCLRWAFDFLAEQDVRGEVLVADNGSRDGSPQLARQCGARVVHAAAPGYGAALAAGIAAARGRFVIMGDCDCSYDFHALAPFLAQLRGGADLVMGNRFRGGIARGAMPWSHRCFGNPLLTAVGRLFFKSPCGDFYCGLRGFRKQAIVELELQATGMEFALEMLVKATMNGLRVAEVPTTLRPDGRDRPPHLRTLRDGWRSLRFFLLFSPRWLFIYPGALLLLFGLVTGAWLLPAPRRVGGLSLDVHSLFYTAVAISVGFQTLAFGLFAKLMAIGAGLHPPNPRVERLLTGPTLEGGLLLGAALFLVGVAGTIQAFLCWADADFGALDPFAEMRIIIPSALALTLGSQIVFSSFFLGFINLQRRRPNQLALARRNSNLETTQDQLS